jgi:hypothetical protein
MQKRAAYMQGSLVVLAQCTENNSTEQYEQVGGHMAL